MPSKFATLFFVVLAASPVTDAFAKGSSGSSGKSPPPPAPEQKQSHDDIASAYLQTIETTRNGQNDDDAVASVRKIVGFYKDPDVAPATKQAIPRFVDWYAKRKSKPVALAGIGGLADIGKGPGTQRLIHVLDGLLNQKDAPAELVTAAFTGLKTAADSDPAITGPLLLLLASKDKQIVADAVDVFNALGASPVSDRKRLVDALLTTFESMSATAAKAADKDAVDRWAALAGSAAGVLGTLAHQQFADIVVARKWVAEHGAEAGTWK